jgi:regulator of cell morphogenesis and NO signaling
MGEACAEKGVAVSEVLAALAEATREARPAEDWSRATPAELVRHIVERHHAYVRGELPHLQSMAGRVAAKHGALHPEVSLIQRNLAQLADEILFHLDKEEHILFPYIEGMQRSSEKHAAAPSACFATVENPIRAMIDEHDGAAALLTEMRAVTHQFAPWPGACATTVGLYYGLDAFERDLHRHVHLENNLLFPKAIDLEKAIGIKQ